MMSRKITEGVIEYFEFLIVKDEMFCWIVIDLIHVLHNGNVGWF